MMGISKIVLLLLPLAYHAVGDCRASIIAAPSGEEQDFQESTPEMGIDYSGNLFEALTPTYVAPNDGGVLKDETARNLRAVNKKQARNKKGKKSKGLDVDKVKSSGSNGKNNKKSRKGKNRDGDNQGPRKGHYVRYRASIKDPRHFYVSQVTLEDGMGNDEEVYLYFRKPLSKKRIAELLNRSKVQILNQDYKRMKPEDMKNLDKPSRNISWIYDEEKQKFYRYRGERDGSRLGKLTSSTSRSSRKGMLDAVNHNIDIESDETEIEDIDNDAVVDSTTSGVDDESNTVRSKKSKRTTEETEDVESSLGGLFGNEDGSDVTETSGDSNANGADDEDTLSGKRGNRKDNRKSTISKRNGSSTEIVNNKKINGLNMNTTRSKTDYEEDNDEVSSARRMKNRYLNEENDEDMEDSMYSTLTEENDSSGRVSNRKVVRRCTGKGENRVCKRTTVRSGSYDVSDDNGNPMDNSKYREILDDEIASDSSSRSRSNSSSNSNSNSNSRSSSSSSSRNVTLTGRRRLDEDGNVIMEKNTLSDDSDGTNSQGKGSKAARDRLWSRRKMQKEIIQVKDKVVKIDKRLEGAENQLEGITRL